MRQLFLDVLDISLSGSVLIVVILFLRLILKRTPKKYICLLWLLAVLRLLVPFEIESAFSLQPRVEPVTESQWIELENYGQILAEDVSVDTGSLVVPHLSSSDPVAEETPPVTVTTSYSVNWWLLLPYIWAAGVVVMVLYTAISWLRLRRRVRDSVVLSEGVWVSGKLDTAFVLGILRPRIYLNLGLTEAERELVLLHERCHIRRGDHLWKLLGFFSLAVHWFNPLVWVAYLLLCRDMEMACDEAVVRYMDTERRKDYSAALLRCGTGSRSIAACPVAFGEVSIKNRILAVLHYQKPGFWVVLLAMITVAAVAVCFLTTPAMTEDDILESLYAELEKIQTSEDLYMEVSIRTVSEHSYFRGQEQQFWKHGNDWYRLIAYETREGTYWEHYLQARDNQYVSRNSEQIPRLESLEWTVMPEEHRLEMYPLLTRDWTKETVLEIREEADGGYSILIQGDLEGNSQVTYYEHTHEFHLDENCRLVNLIEYSRTDRYEEGLDGTAGRYDMEGWSECRFREADAAENERIIVDNLQKVWNPDGEWDIDLGTVTMGEENAIQGKYKNGVNKSLLNLLDVSRSEIRSAYIVNRRACSMLRDPKRLEELVSGLDKVRWDSEPIAPEGHDQWDEEETWWMYLENGEEAIGIWCTADGTKLWLEESEGEFSPVYTVETPEALVAVFESADNGGVIGRTASGESFATADAPTAWVRGISPDAVEKAVITKAVKTYDSPSTIYPGGVLYLPELEKVISLLNGLAQGSFAAVETVQKEDPETSFTSVLGEIDGLCIRIQDGTNDLTAYLRLNKQSIHPGSADRVELVLIPGRERILGGYPEAQYWIIQSEELLTCLQEMREFCSYINYHAYYQEQFDP